MQKELSSIESNQIFISIILVLRNKEKNIKKDLSTMINKISSLVSDFEIVVIDNASTDKTFDELKRLTKKEGLPNLRRSTSMVVNQADTLLRLLRSGCYSSKYSSILLFFALPLAVVLSAIGLVSARPLMVSLPFCSRDSSTK